jgi:hypothetical protein
MVPLDIRQKIILVLVRLLGNQLALMVLLTSSRPRLRSSKEPLSMLL